MNSDVKITKTHKKTKKLIFGIILAIVIVLLFGMAGYLIGRTGKTDTANQTKQVAKTTTAPTSSTTPTQTKPTQTTNPPAQSGSNPSTQQPTQPAITTCTTNHLILSVVPGENGAAGTIVYTLNLTNTGKLACTLYGFPGVSLTNDAGVQIGSPAGRATGYTEAKLMLVPAGSVKFEVSTSNSGAYPDGQCTAGATTFRVYPPDSTEYLTTISPVKTWCPGFETAPVLAI